MKRRLLPTLGLLFSLLGAAACADTGPTASTPANVDGPSFGKNTDTDPRAVWEYHKTTTSGTPAGIRGDGQATDGSPLLSSSTIGGAYQNDVCGVGGKIFEGGSGDATIQPTANYNKSLSCGPRTIYVDLGGSMGTQKAHFMNVRDAVDLANSGNKTSLQPFQVTIDNYPACELLRFGHTVNGVQVGDEILVTYLGKDAQGRRVWSAESTDNHEAGCFKYSKGSYQWDKMLRPVPFYLVITEVPYVAQ